MKRLLFVLLLFSLTVLTACAMQEDHEPIEEDPVVKYRDLADQLVFDWSTYTFTNTVDYDLVYNASTPYQDYLLLVNTFTTIELSSLQIEAYSTTFSLIEDYTEEGLVTYDEISATTLSEFYTFDKNLTTEAAFSIAALQVDIDCIQAETYYYALSKLAYLENRLNITLSNDDIDNLDYLQSVYITLYEKVGVYDIKSHNFESFIQTVEAETSFVPSTSESAQLESAYAIIKQLYENP